MKQKYVQTYMNMAEELAKLSSAKRLQVGAIACKDSRIIACGYNGTPSGTDNCCEEEVTTYPLTGKDFKEVQLRTKPEVIHAEENVVYFAAKYGISLDGCEMLVTHAPCMFCAKGIKQSGIIRIYYKHQYRDLSGVELLKNLGVEVIQI